MSPKVYIFTEQGEKCGLGHLSRCIALYEEIESRGYEPHLFLDGDLEMPTNLYKSNVTFMNWWNIKSFSSNFFANVDFAIIDSYIADEELYEFISKNTKRTLYLDDTNRMEYPDGIIVNPILSINNLGYSKNNMKKLYYGKEYIILRSSFKGKCEKTINESVRDVLVNLGGGDSQNLNDSIIDSVIGKEENSHFHMILPKSQYNYFLEKHSTRNLTFYNNVSGSEMNDLMDKVDVAISGAGQSTYELIYMLVPFIAVKTADNQSNNIKALSNAICNYIIVDAKAKGSVETIYEKFQCLKDSNARQKLSCKQQNIIDGNGKRRIVDLLLQDNSKIKIIKANDSHLQKVYDLSNQEYVRRNSKNPDLILWEDHVEWFEKALIDPDIVFLVVLYNDQFAGQVRFIIENDKATVNISLSEFVKGKKLSKSILMKSLDKLFCERNIELVEAEIFADNIASVRLFESAGFTLQRKCENQLIYVLKRV